MIITYNNLQFELRADDGKTEYYWNDVNDIGIKKYVDDDERVWIEDWDGK